MLPSQPEGSSSIGCTLGTGKLEDLIIVSLAVQLNDVGALILALFAMTDDEECRTIVEALLARDACKAMRVKVRVEIYARLHAIPPNCFIAPGAGLAKLAKVAVAAKGRPKLSQIPHSMLDALLLLIPLPLLADGIALVILDASSRSHP